MPRISKERLDEFERLKNATTQGEWVNGWGKEKPSGEEWNQVETISGEMVVGLMQYDGLWAGCNEQNSEFIAIAHNTSQDLIDTIRELERENEGLRKRPVVPSEVEYLIEVLRGGASELADNEYQSGVREGIVMAASNIEFVIRKLKEQPNDNGT